MARFRAEGYELVNADCILIDRLGFRGRGECLAAQAVVLLER
jgi:hypothetical protein